MLHSLRRLVFASLLCLCFAYTDEFNSKTYVIDNPDFLLIPKSVDFVEILSNELFSKTGYSLYVAVVDKTPEVENTADKKQDNSQSNKELSQDLTLKRAQYKDSLIKNAKAPYTLIFFMREDMKMGLLSSNPNTYFDEDKVYFEYMVPLLPKQKDEELSPQLVSAIILNGYAQAADMIAEHFNVKLENNMSVDESGGREFVRFSMYVMLLVMFGIIGIIYLTRKK